MQDQTTRRAGRFAKGSRRRSAPNGRSRNGLDGNRSGGGQNGRPRREVNGNRLTRSNGNRGETAVCIKCGHPAPDGKLCGFHRQLLNALRKEIPEQDPRRLRL